MTLSTLILAFIQSLTEFLPVSSSGHLLLAESWGIAPSSLRFDAVLHLGTLLAVCLYFFKDLWAMLWGIWKTGFERRLFVQLVIATFPVLIAGYFIYDIAGTVLRTPYIVGWTAVIFGTLLWFVDKNAKKNTPLRHLTYTGAFIIGCAQILSLVPGVSRSGITMTAGRFMGLKRVDTARFSMLLSIPTIFVAGFFALFNAGQGNELPLPVSQITEGITLSAVFGLIAIWFLMKWVEKASFAIFAVYRILLGGVIFLMCL